MLLIKLPSRSRPAKLLACIQNIRAMVGPVDYLIALNLDLDDKTVNNRMFFLELSDIDDIIISWSLSKNKIDAINRSTPTKIDWSHMIVTADDFWFVAKDFGKQVLNDFEEYFPDGDGLLHYPDGHVNQKLITMPIMGRKYFDRTGYIYHPSYVSVKADTEQMEVAQRLGKYRYVPIQIADHRHPRWTKEPKDAQLAKQDSRENFLLDGMTFHNRKLKNFDLC